MVYKWKKSCRATFGLHEKNAINEFLDYLGIPGARLSKILFNTKTEQWNINQRQKEAGIAQDIIAYDSTYLVFDNDGFLNIQMQGARYDYISFQLGQYVNNLIGDKKLGLEDGSSFFGPAIGKRIASIGMGRAHKYTSGLDVTFFNGTRLSLCSANEDFYHIIYNETESKPFCLPLWEAIHTQYGFFLDDRWDFSDATGLSEDDIYVQLKFCKAFIDYICEGREMERVRGLREAFEKYYIYDRLTEDEFLEACNRLDFELNDDTGALLDSRSQYVRLKEYVEKLQTMTHRRQ